MTLQEFLDKSPVNFLAVKTMKEVLTEAGYTEVKAGDKICNIKAGSRFFVTKNDSSLYAFHVGQQPMSEGGFHLICAHCDNPTFRIKPNAQMVGDKNIVRLNTEVYGGPIMSTWFDRPLSLAGRVITRGKDALHPNTHLLHIQRNLLTIPNLAIHFNRQVNDGIKLSKQKDMLPILGYITNEMERENALLNLVLTELIAQGSLPQGADKSEILDFDLYLYDTTPACTVGLHQEFIQSGRLDDLSMVHAGLSALLAADANGEPQVTRALAIFDNEETGSQTKQGAGSPFLASILERIIASETTPKANASETAHNANVTHRYESGNVREGFFRAIEQAFMVSADNAHAWHPNYSEKYDPTNHPVMGGGPVIKYNAAQKYASDAASAAVFMELCREAGVPCQTFVNHSDVAGGSTLGNILASSLPLRGVDMGNPIWAMHSVRETGSVADHEYCIKAFTQFYN